MRRKITLFLMFALMCAVNAQILEPIKWKSSIQENGDKVTLTLTANIENGWHLYTIDIDPEIGPRPTTIALNLTNLKAVDKMASKSKVISKFDPIFEAELSWYEKEAKFTQTYKKESDDWSLSGDVSYMACNDESCMMGEPYIFKFGNSNVAAKALPTTSTEEGSLEETAENNEEIALANDSAAEVAQPVVADIYAPVIDQLKEFGETTSSKDSSLWMIFLLGLMGGFIALFTPCVWPIIPMTVSFFLKRSGDKRKGRRDALLYGVSIIIIYLALGLLVTAIFGASALNNLATNAVFNIIFFLLLVLFAVSFFGAFELTLPASWTSKLDAKAESTTGFLSILLMAFTLVLVSFSCTGPIIGTLLVEAAQGSWVGPAIGMFGFALALALPFSLFAMFPSMLKSMPKSGGWLNSVKVVLGFLELALSLKFLSVADLAYGWSILDRETFIVLWVVIFAMLGFYLLGKIKLPHDDELEHVSVTRLSLALISFAYAIYLVPGLWGAPLRSASAFAPPLTTQDFNLYENEVHPQTTDYETGISLGIAQNKPILIDFSGFGCVNCRKMEAAVWTDIKVASMLDEDFVLVSLMVDDRTPLAKPFVAMEKGVERTFLTVGDKNSYIQRVKFGANAQPFYVAIDCEGNVLNNSYSFDEDPAKFLEFLKQCKENFNNEK